MMTICIALPQPGLRVDLRRRDFTVNAMALSLDGTLYDYFGGQQDLQQKILRTVGNAKQRFHEDALRMLRACRFVAQLGFTYRLRSTACLRCAEHALLPAAWLQLSG